MEQVDDVLDRLGAELAERDARIAELESALAGAQAVAMSRGRSERPAGRPETDETDPPEADPLGPPEDGPHDRGMQTGGDSWTTSGEGQAQPGTHQEGNEG
jgi:hypothetical protein